MPELPQGVGTTGDEADVLRVPLERGVEGLQGLGELTDHPERVGPTPARVDVVGLVEEHLAEGAGRVPPLLELRVAQA